MAKEWLLNQIDMAFSRDQEEKVYVQHKILSRSRKLYSWLEEGAKLYVCGDASRMASDVEAALVAVVQKESGKTEEEARGYIKSLKKAKRYLEDVY